MSGKKGMEGRGRRGRSHLALALGAHKEDALLDVAVGREAGGSAADGDLAPPLVAALEELGRQRSHLTVRGRVGVGVGLGLDGDGPCGDEEPRGVRDGEAQGSSWKLVEVQGGRAHLGRPRGGEEKRLARRGHDLEDGTDLCSG